MRLICVILLISTLALLFHTTVADIDEEKELAISQLNDDDTSLFRGVENAIDEDSEDDAYRILKSLQDVRDDEIDEDEEFNQDSNDEEDEEEEDNDDDNDILFDEDEDEEEEEDDDFSAGLPEFKNEETADFFEHLPQQPIDNGDNKLSIVEDNIEEEEVDDELDELAPKPDDEEEEEEEDNEELQIENSTPTPVLPPIVNENIPWQRPEPIIKVNDNSNFYQDINYKESEKLKQKAQTKSNFQFWHLFFIFMILAIVYNSITKRKVLYRTFF